MARCVVCRTTSTERCSKCHTPYCSRTCQLMDWKRDHKAECIKTRAGAKALTMMGALSWDGTFSKAKLTETCPEDGSRVYEVDGKTFLVDADNDVHFPDAGAKPARRRKVRVKRKGHKKADVKAAVDHVRDYMSGAQGTGVEAARKAGAELESVEAALGTSGREELIKLHAETKDMFAKYMSDANMARLMRGDKLGDPKARLREHGLNMMRRDLAEAARARAEEDGGGAGEEKGREDDGSDGESGDSTSGEFFAHSLGDDSPPAAPPSPALRRSTSKSQSELNETLLISHELTGLSMPLGWELIKAGFIGLLPQVETDQDVLALVPYCSVMRTAAVGRNTSPTFKTHIEALGWEIEETGTRMTAIHVEIGLAVQWRVQGFSTNVNLIDRQQGRAVLMEAQTECEALLNGIGFAGGVGIAEAENGIRALFSKEPLTRLDMALERGPMRLSFSEIDMETTHDLMPFMEGFAAGAGAMMGGGEITFTHKATLSLGHRGTLMASRMSKKLVAMTENPAARMFHFDWDYHVYIVTDGKHGPVLLAHTFVEERDIVR